MSVDPYELLNVEEDPKASVAPTGYWWVASLVSLAGFTSAGFCVAFAMPRLESDWFGIRFIAAIGGGLLVGALFCVIFAAVSVVKRERHCVWAAMVSLPCLAILLALALEPVRMAVEAHQRQERAALTEHYRQQIRADPGIALREKWHLPPSDVQYLVFRESFDDEKVPYNDTMLEKIYQEAPGMRDYLFRHSACTPEFLAAHFPAAFTQGPTFSYVQLASIVSNPHTPIELVEKVAGANGLPFGAVDAAKTALKKRSRN